MKDFKARWEKAFYLSDGGKERINLKLIFSVSGAIFGLLFLITSLMSNHEETGHSKRSDRRLFPSENRSATIEVEPNNVETFRAATLEPQVTKEERPSRSKSTPIQLKAQQVISRGSDESEGGGLPTGTNLIGKLLSAVDTREMSSMVRVLLPYGARFQGRDYLARDTILVGRASYSGKGERVFLTFERAISPNGQEIPIQAHALDTSDYVNGLRGHLHSETGVRIAGTLGLTMISGMADVLTERTAHGDFGITTPKSTMRNAVLQGASRVTEMEASRQAEGLAQASPYVTLDAGMDMIVTLSSPLRDK